MTHAKDTRPTPQNQLVSDIIAELRGAARLARYRALDKLEAEIDRIYPPERYSKLLDPQHDWSE